MYICMTRILSADHHGPKSQQNACQGKELWELNSSFLVYRQHSFLLNITFNPINYLHHFISSENILFFINFIKINPSSQKMQHIVKNLLELFKCLNFSFYFIVAINQLSKALPPPPLPPPEIITSPFVTPFPGTEHTKFEKFLNVNYQII